MFVEQRKAVFGIPLSPAGTRLALPLSAGNGGVYPQLPRKGVSVMAQGSILTASSVFSAVDAQLGPASRKADCSFAETGCLQDGLRRSLHSVSWIVVKLLEGPDQ